MNQPQLLPTSYDISLPESSDDNDDNNEKVGMEEVPAQYNNVDWQEEDASVGTADSGGSVDNSCEAKIHDAEIEFEAMENSFDNIHGVGFVHLILGAPQNWIPPGP
jgi:hypothetical protein